MRMRTLWIVVALIALAKLLLFIALTGGIAWVVFHLTR